MSIFIKIKNDLQTRNSLAIHCREQNRCADRILVPHEFVEDIRHQTLKIGRCVGMLERHPSAIDNLGGLWTFIRDDDWNAAVQHHVFANGESIETGHGEVKR